MKSLLTTAIILFTAMSASDVKANLVIDVTGVAGSGVTTWTFTTISVGIAEADGTIRDNSANTFNAADTGQFPFGEDTILDTSIQNLVFALTGNAMITVGGTTESLTGIFLDDDGGSADDLGIRVANPLAYLALDETTWTGSGTVNVDITAFALGSWSINEAAGQNIFISDPIIVNFSAIAIPEPGCFGILACLSLGCVVRRRRK